MNTRIVMSSAHPVRSRFAFRRALTAGLAWLLALGAAQAPSSGLAQAADQGIVIGSVFNAATGDYLGGAVVSIEGASHSDVTDRTGRFQINQVPVGTQSLKVTYPGLDPLSRSISVVPGQNNLAAISLSSDVYQLGEFVVAGIREGNAQAIAMQQQAPNMKTVIATDAYGHIADGNLGEFLKRLSGISTGGSIDEVTTIRVRGAAPEHTAVTLDGTRLPSPGGEKTSREFEVDKLPADFIESIEVVKAPTPDMDADAIGGTVNLISKSAFDTQGRYFSYRFGINHQTLFDNTGSFGNLQYSEAFGKERKFGVFLNFNYSKSYRDRDSATSFYAGPADGPNPVWRVRFQPDERQRERTGGGAKFDYRFSDTASMFVSIMYNDYEQDNRAREFTVEVREDRAIPGDDTRDLSQTEPSDNLRTVYALGREATQSNTTLDTQKTWSFQIGGKKHWVDSGYRLDYSAAYAPANGHQDRWLFNVQGARNSPWVIEREEDLDYFPTMTRTSGLGLMGDWNPSSISKSPFFRYQDSEEAVWAGHINLSKELATRNPVTLKAGMRYRGQELEKQFFEDGRRDRTYDAPDWNIFKETAAVQERPFFGIDRYADLALFADARAIFEYTQANPEYWEETFSPREIRESYQDNGTAREEVTAGYVQATARFGKLQVLGGLRMEETKVTGAGWEYNENNDGPPDDASQDELIEFYRSEWTFRENNRSYRNWFPGLHFRYEIRPNLLARASYSGGIGRPRFDRLIPKTTINDGVDDDGDPSQSIRMNNTGLLPQESENYDFSLEYYFQPVGVFAVGIFQKDITNFIYDIETNLTPDLLEQFGLGSQYEGWEFRTEGNQGRGRIRGYEIDYSQHLSGIASWLKGVSIYANYTHVYSEGELTDIIGDSWNVGVAYEKRPWTIRYHVNYNSSYQTSFDERPTYNDYDESQTNGEISVSYRFRPWLTVFADMNNTFQRDMRNNVGGPALNGRLLAGRVQDIGQRIMVGVSGRF